MAEDLKRALNLFPHPEGGWYREIYVDKSAIPQPRKEHGLIVEKRGWSSHIYYMLSENEYSKFHRLRCDECMCYYSGNTAVLVHCIAADGTLTTMELDCKTLKFFITVPKGSWFSIELADQCADSYALIGCSVAPAFNYAELEFGDKATLINHFPQHATLISKLT